MVSGNSTVPLIISTLKISTFPKISTPFLPQKMCLFWEGEDFGKIKSLYLSNIESFKTHLLLFLKNSVM